jgi:hypothetical protein
MLLGMTARFSIDLVFDLPARQGLLAVGKVQSGVVTAGMTLLDTQTGTPVKVLGVEFESPADRRLGQTTLLLERTPTVTAGRVLESTT